MCMWLSGPYPPSMHDLSVFRGGEKDQPKDSWEPGALYFHLNDGQRIVGDSGYRGEPSKIVVKSDAHSAKMKDFLSRVESRQETFFKGLKDYKILNDRFAYGCSTRERMDLHKTVVEAVAVIKQYDYENGHPPFEIVF